MDFLVVQFLTGLAGASSLFLVASGLSIIFGLTRIVNFAHGAFYMLGAYLAYSLTERLSGALGFWGGLGAAVLAVVALGALTEILLLRRIYRAPELFQLLATFGLTLMVEDLVVIVWGPDDLLGRRAPGLGGAVEILGQAVPRYDLFLIGLGPLVLALVWLLFNRTRFGLLVRAAIGDREMVAALGVNGTWLFTGVFALGTGLAALGGALQIPREAVNHTMDLGIIVEAFVIVVIGGLGSVPGAFVAALLVSELNAFGILVLPGISLVLVFAVMALVLVVRPWGLFGRPEAPARAAQGIVARPWHPLGRSERLGLAVLFGAALAAPVFLGDYGLNVGAEILIVALFAASLQMLMSVGGLVSFGHATPFGLGAYGAALAATGLGWPFAAAIAAGMAAGTAGALVIGWFCVRLSGVYLAMLTLAFAQIAWSVASQWTGVTGGDNGILGVWPPGWAADPRAFYWLTLALCGVGLAALRAIAFAPFGYGLRALRDSPLRAEAIGIARRPTQWAAFVLAGAFAALGGALFAFLKGSVFPDVLSIATSVDALVMVLLGGLGTVSGAAFGAALYRGLSILIRSHTDWSKLVLGGLIIAVVLVWPTGLGGLFDLVRGRLRPGAAAEGARSQ